MIVLIIIWALVHFLLVYNYLLYPFVLRLLVQNKQHNQITYSESENLPLVHIVIAAYNEEEVIQEKINSVLASDYPKDRLKIIVGSDHSTDRTNEILKELDSAHDDIEFIQGKTRLGKIGLLNHMMDSNKENFNGEDIIVLTDANVMFQNDTLIHLVKHFKNEEIGIVGANVVNQNIKAGGVANQEQFYIQRENEIKHLEGKLNGSMIGAFGACFALRYSIWEPIPAHFIVDDFFLGMTCFEKGFKSILEPEAICFEDLPGDIEVEYRRKKRISAGNFQNLFRFAHMLWPPFRSIGFCFSSHKLLRWIGPGLLLIGYICSIILSLIYPPFIFATAAYHLLLILAIIDYFLAKAEIHLILLRFNRYFLLMNLALAVGFVTFLKGIKTNVWQPTKRNT